MQRIIDHLNVLTQGEMLVGLVGLLQRPIVVMRVENARVRLNRSANQGSGEQFEFVADLRDFLEHPVIGATAVREDSTVKLLGPKPRLPPAEEQNGIRPARNQLIREHAQHARPHQRIHVLPSHVAGFLLHDPETRAAVRRPNVRLLQ